MNKIYLDNACTCLFDERILQAPQTMIDLLSDPDITAGDGNRTMRGYYEKARAAVAGLIHCKPQEVALVESTSHALQILTSILALQKEDNVLICDLEYQASVLCFKRRQEEVGFEIRRICSHGGAVEPADYEAQMDEHTAVVIAAAVQEINGFRMDIAALAEAAHRHGALLIVDGIQEVGAMQVDVKQTGADFYCAGGKKWLGNPFGMGFLYVSEQLIPQLKPVTYAYFHTAIPEKYHGDFITYLENPQRTPFDPFTLHRDASIFEIGGFGNYVGALGLAKSIEVLQTYGTAWIEERILSLVQYLVGQLQTLPVQIASPTDPAHMSPTVSFNFGLHGGSSFEKKLERYLIDRRIYVSLRCCTNTGGIRVSINYYNTKEELDVLLDAVREFIALHRQEIDALGAESEE